MSTAHNIIETVGLRLSLIPVILFSYLGYPGLDLSKKQWGVGIFPPPISPLYRLKSDPRLKFWHKSGGGPSDPVGGGSVKSSGGSDPPTPRQIQPWDYPDQLASVHLIYLKNSKY